MCRYRRSALLIARGETLEIGFGTGLNLPHYPESVSQLTGVDTENMMQPWILKRISASAIPVTRMQIAPGRGLPFDER
ncbi:MAG: SAM-dependent methyltransferase, partial [Blastocatellia bacterium]|nr:SAM-dependent methyltransferase [Blastocatellia bacterium]